MEYSKSNILRGAIIYSSGDTVASLMMHEFSWMRLFGMVVIGATIYAFEIPNYFHWIEQRTSQLKKTQLWLSKTLLALLYFNPLWIARHLLFIKVFSGTMNEINFSLIQIAGMSFLVNIPLSFIGNYIIQNRIQLSWRFMASALFSGLMAIYYALSWVLF